MRKDVTTAYIGSQGSYKAYTDYLKAINISKSSADDVQAADDFLSAFKGGFKGEL